METRMKCFGGELDNRCATVPHHLRAGELWRNPIRRHTIASSPEVEPPPPTMDYEQYVVETMSTPKVEVKFLRSVNLPLETILLRMFT